jgi:hypothetical protein
VWVLDVNERPTLPDITLTVKENSMLGAYVGADALVADDPDIFADQTISYVVVPPTSTDYFKVGFCDGLVTVAVPKLNHERTSMYKLYLTIGDDGNNPAPLFSASTLTILVLDVNEPPEWVVSYDGTISRAVDEHSPVGTDIGDPVIAVDVDDGQADQLAYFITGGNSAGAFEMDQWTGQLRVADSGALDHERNGIMNGNYELQLLVSDNGIIDGKFTGNLSTPISITVNVRDVNEFPLLSSAVYHVKEMCERTDCSSFATQIGIVAATDVDVGQQSSLE